MEEKETKKEKTFYKKWWFWLIILAIVIAIGFTIIMAMAFEYARGGIHQVAFDVQSIDDEATVYSSAGENTIIVDGMGDKGALNTRITQIQKAIEETKSS